jgi:replicative DNA helicase
MIVVDYITLMEMPNKERRDLSVGEISRQMKQLAKELKTPVMMLSQLNRTAANEKREPIPSDLRDSGSIEQDADKILFPYREELHNPNTPNKRLAKVIKAKARDGELGSVPLEFINGNFYQTDLEWIEQEPEREVKRKKFDL